MNPLSLAALEVSELLDFDVESLCKEPELEVEENEWGDGEETEISIIRAYTEGGGVVLETVDDSPPLDDDSYDEDFVWDGEDGNDSEDVSLEEELGDSDSGDDDQLEAQVE